MKTVLQHTILAAALLILSTGIRAQSVFHDAEDLFRKGEYEKALTVYRATMITEKDSLAHIDARMEYIRECHEIKERADSHYRAADFDSALTACRSLLSKNPSDPHAAECLAFCETQIARLAEQHNESLFWNEAKRKNTVAALRAYLAKYPKGAHATAAGNRLAALDDEQWNAIAPDAPDSLLIAYIDQYPRGRHVEQARRRLADAADDRRWQGRWQEALQKNDEAALIACLDEYPPHGRHAGEVRRLLAVLADNRNWREAKEQNSYSAYRRYLDASRLRTYEKEAFEAIFAIDEARIQTENVHRAEEYLRAGEYSKAKNEIQKVNLDALPPDMRDSVRTYLGEIKYHTEIKPSSSLWELEYYLKEYPRTPYRAEIETEIEAKMKKIEAKSRRLKLWENIKPVPMLGLGIKTGVLTTWSWTIPLYLKLRNEYDVVELITGIEYTKFIKNYDREYSSDEGYDGRHYEITAHQLSVPATLKLNPDHSSSRTYLSITGTYNYNYQGKCFGTHNAEFVNRTTCSGIIALGCEGINDDVRCCLELFLRKDFHPLFVGRKKIYESDNRSERNDYQLIDSAINSTALIGLSLVLYFNIHN